MSRPDILDAMDFARRAHQGQKRKYTNVPYYTHCVAVSKLIKDHGGTDEEIMAAVLHDTVEDTEVTHEMIFVKFGYQVFQRVFWLTDISKLEDGNRELRKTIDRMHLIGSHDLSVYRIKCADMIDNGSSIKDHDEDFAKIYLQEKDALLKQMAATVPAIKFEPLFDKAMRIL